MNNQTKPNKMTNGNEPISAYKHDSPNGAEISSGLTKREYFAAMAMQGLLDKANSLTSAGYTSEQAVVFADALINALNQTK